MSEAKPVESIQLAVHLAGGPIFLHVAACDIDALDKQLREVVMKPVLWTVMSQGGPMRIVGHSICAWVFRPIAGPSLQEQVAAKHMAFLDSVKKDISAGEEWRGPS